MVPDPQVYKKVDYEQPLNERMRTFLRLEFLFQAAGHHARGRSVWDSRAAMASLLDILAIVTRSDLKSEVLKELERHTANLTAMQNNPQVDGAKLAGIMQQLDGLATRLHATHGQIAYGLRQNEFLASIRQRSSIAGGSCGFDLPVYHHWLQRPAPERVEQLLAWFTEFEPIRAAIALMLELTRESCTPSREVAPGGFFQQPLPAHLPCQMLRVALPQGSPYYAEISGSRHRFTIRFLEGATNGRAIQTDDTVEFELTRCVL